MNRKPVKARKRKKCKLVGKAIKQLQSVFGCNLGVISGVANKGTRTWFHLPFDVISMIVISFSNIASPTNKTKIPPK